MGGRRAKFWRPNYFVWLSSRRRVGGGITFSRMFATHVVSEDYIGPTLLDLLIIDRWNCDPAHTKVFSAAVSDFDCSASCSCSRGEEGKRVGATNGFCLRKRTTAPTPTLGGDRKDEGWGSSRVESASLAPIGKLIPTPPNDREPVAPQKFHFFQRSCNEQIWQ